MRVVASYYLTVGLIFLACTGLFGFFVVNWTNPVSLIQFSLLIFFTFSFALTFVKRLFSLFLRPNPPSNLQGLEGGPSVAVLYTTMNDVVPECLERIDQSHAVDVYVLDDSTDLTKRRMVDALCASKGFTILRREERVGYKAGAINDWLEKYGFRYDYFVLLDADSILPRDWVGECLKYAEHPDNRYVAIFQGLINIWNLDNNFTSTLAPIHRLSQDEWEKKLANHLDAVLFYGHNALLRTRPVIDAGGFPVNFVSEDYALAVRLADRGYTCRFVPLHTFEALPENVRGFVRRQNKWTRGAMEFFGFARRSKISPARKLTLLEVPLGHVSYLCMLAAMFLAIYGANSSLKSSVVFVSSFLASPVIFILSIPLFRYTFFLAIVSAIITGLKLVQVRLSPIRYWRFQILSRSIGGIMLPHEARAILYYLFNRTKRFPVTPKNEPPLGVRDVFSLAWMTILYTLVLVLGISLLNPVGLFYNIGWILPLATAPFIIYHFSTPGDSQATSRLQLDMLQATSVEPKLGQRPLWQTRRGWPWKASRVGETKTSQER